MGDLTRSPARKPDRYRELLRALTPRLADPRGGVLDLYLHADLGGRLGDPLHGIVHAIRPPLGIGGLQQLGDPWARVRADRRLTGAVQLQLEVELGAPGCLSWGFPGRH